MAKYHKYVFDLKKRKFVGDFEKMYRDEGKKIFDSWHQDDSRQLQRKIDLEIISQYNFDNIVDIGCGKGAFTHLLKKRNNQVYAVDISKTAVKIARERYPDIYFDALDVNNEKKLNEYLKSAKPDLVFTSEVLSYLKNWKSFLKTCARYSEYFLISLYIPENPIGYVKSEQELLDEIKKHYTIVEHISINTSRFFIIFGKKSAKTTQKQKLILAKK